MTSLQISMTEKQKNYSKDLLIKARASFENNGDRYSFASTIIRVLEEWSKNKGFIKNTVQGSKDATALNLILNDPEEMEFIRGVIRAAETTPNPSNLRILTEYIKRVDSNWKLPKEGGKLAVVRKIKELFMDESFVDIDDYEVGEIIRKHGLDVKGKSLSEMREEAKKLRGSK